MKNIYEEVHLWLSCRLTVFNFQLRSLRFSSNKDICGSCVIRQFFLSKKIRERDCATLTKNDLLQRFFGRILTENIPWHLSEQLLIRTSLFQNISVAASERCLIQLDYYCVFNFARLLFSRVYLRHQVQLPSWLI